MATKSPAKKQKLKTKNTNKLIRFIVGRRTPILIIAILLLAGGGYVVYRSFAATAATVAYVENFKYIKTMNVFGDNTKVLASGGDYREVAISPNYSNIVFTKYESPGGGIHDQNLYTKNLATNTTTKIYGRRTTDRDVFSRLQYTNSGSSVLFIDRKEDYSSATLKRISISSKSETKIFTPVSGDQILNYSISPDGTKIAVLTSKSGIHIMNITDGSGSRKISTSSGASVIIGWENNATVLFTESKHLPSGTYVGSTIFRVATDGSTKEEIIYIERDNNSQEKVGFAVIKGSYIYLPSHDDVTKKVYFDRVSLVNKEVTRYAETPYVSGATTAYASLPAQEDTTRPNEIFVTYTIANGPSSDNSGSAIYKLSLTKPELVLLKNTSMSPPQDLYSSVDF